MKFCKNCGTQLEDTMAFCTNCGTASEQPTPVQQDVAPQAQVVPQPVYAPQQPYTQPAPQVSGLATAAKVFMIIGTVFMGLYLIPLAWCLPMTLSYCKKLKTGEPVGTGFKICALLFVSFIGGILMLCDKD